MIYNPMELRNCDLVIVRQIREWCECSEGEVEHYVRGVSPADLSALARQSVLHSEPVLPGGKQIQQTTR